jgi:hypothetical protein
MDGGELLREAEPHAVGGVGVQSPAVGHERDHAAVLDPQGGPLDGADVGVVERVLVGRLGAKVAKEYAALAPTD